VSQTGIAVHSSRANRSALLLGEMSSHTSILNELIGHHRLAREPQSTHSSRPGRSTTNSLFERRIERPERTIITNALWCPRAYKRINGTVWS